MTASPPGVGTVGARWRPVLGPVMAGLAGDGLVVDGRSSSYASVWRPTGPAARSYVAVREFSEVDGRRTIVSHAAKHTRGLVARWVCEADRTPRTPAALATLVAEHRPAALVGECRGGWSLGVELGERSRAEVSGGCGGSSPLMSSSSWASASERR